MIVIGLTGGIASGKSTAAELLKALGAVVIDADRLGHRAYEPGSLGFEAVVNEFGHEIVSEDGTVNRLVLGGKVFGDPEQMQRLNDIVWPAIRRLAKEEITECRRRGAEVVVLEAALLIEAGWDDLVDEIWVVSVKANEAKARLKQRNGLPEDQAQARIDAQLSNRDRQQHANVKIDNSEALAKFEKRIKAQWQKLQKRIQKSAAIGK